MPTYVYRCNTCGNTFEVYKSLQNLDSMEVCSCQSTNTKRLIAPPAAHIWKAEYWDDIAPEPIYITSKRQLIEECKKHKVVAKAYMHGDEHKRSL